MKIIIPTSYQTTKIKIIKEINESHTTKSTPKNHIVLPKMGAFRNRWLMSEWPTSTWNKPHSIDVDNDGNLPIVEDQKIMTPRPKEIMQWANPMTSDHKRDEFTTKKKDGKPKIFEAQNPRKEKLNLPGSRNWGESNRKGWARIPRGYQRLGVLGTCSTAEVGLR